MLLNNTIEIFLFVNPMGTYCYETEQVIKSFTNERKEKVRVRFIPLLNFHTVGSLIKGKEDATLTDRNELYTHSYDVSLAFQSASIQGKKKGRNFLMALQNKIMNEGRKVSTKLFLEVAEEIRLDLEMFEEDLTSDFSKRAFNKDQKLAQDMNVENAPSCVIFTGNAAKSGYRIDTAITKHLLHGLCDEEAILYEKDYGKHLSLLQMI